MVDFAVAAKDFAQNPERRYPCVFVLDTSGSMSGASIKLLNRALQEDFIKALDECSVARRRIEIAIVTFGNPAGNGVEIKQDFETVHKFTAPHLEANRLTLMGSATLKAIDMIQERKAQYHELGIDYYRPLIFLLTDGSPVGEPDSVWREAVEAVQHGEHNGKFCFFAVGVGEDVDTQKLKELSARPLQQLNGLGFKNLFLLLSKSLVNTVNVESPCVESPNVESVNRPIEWVEQLDWSLV